MSRGVDVNAAVSTGEWPVEDKTGKVTPLWIAIEGGHREIEELLRKHGAIEDKSAAQLGDPGESGSAEGDYGEEDSS